ncbi:uncharacterized protein CTRU02_208565 [Colletotrichum truncatum]|uniref:Uncharacterized protein n=1 Tax=Colletotrichum truncatum TaxID=5467 RepID=A0ACC3YWQ9_COLTU|nr:uncharacterized protein CTRU02_10320 [Colletotrichum truncatum]KAF6787524.1 hypothetical protein CTRU02_10320 [Colletotrichum truncatum]
MPAETSLTTAQTSIKHGFLPFSSKSRHPEISAALDDVPRYLFRVHAPTTAGQTTTDYVASRAAVFGLPSSTTDILTIPDQDAAEMINCHLRGWSRNTDNLISWSSSLLFVLQYALYRNVKIGDELSDIQVHVLDTLGLPSGAFISDMALLDTFASKHRKEKMNLSNFRHLRRNTLYNFGEYLCQGTLFYDGRCASASLNDIVHHGLFKLCPEMEEANEKSELAKRVLKMRDQCFGSPSAATKQEIRAALAISQGCFGEEWALPLMAALLSLRKRYPDDDVIIEAFKANFSGKKSFYVYEEIVATKRGALKSFSDERLPEIFQFEGIIQDIHNEHSLRTLDSIIASTIGLSRKLSPENSVVSLLIYFWSPPNLLFSKFKSHLVNFERELGESWKDVSPVPYVGFDYCAG